MSIPIASEEEVNYGIVNRFIHAGQYYYPLGYTCKPYCPDAEVIWRGIEPKEIIKVELYVLAAQLISGGLQGFQANPYLDTVIYKPSSIGEPTGLARNNDDLFIVTPPFPFLNTLNQPQFIRLNMVDGDKTHYENAINKALREYNRLYALVARKGRFNDVDKQVVINHFNMLGNYIWI